MSQIREKRPLLGLLTHALLLVAVAVAVYPLAWVLKMALSSGQELSDSFVPWPRHLSLVHFRELLFAQDKQGHWLFARQLSNSLLASGLTALLGVSLSCSAAFALSRLKFRGRKGVLSGLVATQMFPGILGAIPLYVLLDRMHLLDSLLGLVLVYASGAIPFCVWTLKGHFDALPAAIDEAARMDGASDFAVFYRVLLPLVRPGLVIAALFSFMAAWNEFILAATFLNQETAFTLPVALQRHVGDYQTDWGLFAAGSLVVSVPVMALFFGLQRHLVAGLASGSVKG